MTREFSVASEARAVALLADLVAETRAVREILESALPILRASSNGRGDDVDEPTSTPEKLMTPHEVAELLRVDARTLRELRKRGDAPPAINVGSRPRWRQRDVDKWLEERRAP